VALTEAEREEAAQLLAAVDARNAIRQTVLDELHDKQRAVLEAIEGGAQYITALCGRRAGKTEMDARAIALKLEDCGPDEWVIYAAVTGGLAKDLIWARLAALNERHKFGWRMVEREGLIEAKRGGKFRVLGFDKLPELQKVRGYKLRLAVFDEPATYADKLEELIRECVGPALSDVRGTLLINGTPGAVCAGFWHDASTGGKRRYRNFHWTVLDNDKYPRDAAEMLTEEREENDWTEEDATYQREWMARWVNDPSAQVYKYAQDRDAIHEMPDGYAEFGAGWMFTVGVDFGYSPDPCAWGVLASHKNSRDVYLVHTEEHYELLPDEAAAITARLVARFDPGSVVGDPAGKDYIAEWNRRHADDAKAYMRPADKLGKADAIEVLNGLLRSGRLKVLLPDSETWASQAQHLPWKNTARNEEHPAYPNHSLDCVLYASRAHRAYLNEPAKRHQAYDKWSTVEQRKARNRRKQNKPFAEID